MRRACSSCEEFFLDGEEVVIVYDGQFKDIASKVAYAVSPPVEIREIFHTTCYEAMRNQIP